MGVQWNDSSFKRKVVSAGMDGLNEWGLTVWLPVAKQNCPVDQGTMRNSLGVERDDANKCIYVGGGGQAKAYILKQELDRSLHHNVGKAGFIKDTVEQNISKAPSYIKKRL